MEDPCLPAICPCKKLVSLLLISSLQVLEGCNEAAMSTPELNKPNSPNPLSHTNPSAVKQNSRHVLGVRGGVS